MLLEWPNGNTLLQIPRLPTLVQMLLARDSALSTSLSIPGRQRAKRSLFLLLRTYWAVWLSPYLTPERILNTSLNQKAASNLYSRQATENKSGVTENCKIIPHFYPFSIFVCFQTGRNWFIRVNKVHSALKARRWTQPALKINEGKEKLKQPQRCGNHNTRLVFQVHPHPSHTIQHQCFYHAMPQSPREVQTHRNLAWQAKASVHSFKLQKYLG